MDLQLRRHLYERAAGAGVRRRRTYRKQLRVLAAAPAGRPDDGPAGVREERRPHPPTSPASAARRFDT